MSGSARNHVRYCFANATFRAASSSIACSSVRRPSMTSRLAVADRAERRRQRGRTGSRSARASSTRPASNCAQARCATHSRCVARVEVEPQPGNRRVVPAGATVAVARELASSSARATRRGLRRSVRAARCGATIASRPAAAPSPPCSSSRSIRSRTPESWGRAAVSSPRRRPEGRTRYRRPGSRARRSRRPRGARPRMDHEVRDGVRLVRFCQVEAVMGHPGALRRGHLGRPDVEAATDLPGIGRHDLRRHALVPQSLGDADGEAGLAGRGGPGDDEQRRQHGFRPRREHGFRPRLESAPARRRTSASGSAE